MRKIFLVFFLGVFFGFTSAAWAAYEAELRDQMKKIETDFNRAPEMTYFRDMSIVARKADEAELQELASEIIRLKLLKVMDEYVRAGLKKIHESYSDEPVVSSRGLEDLSRYERFYEPTEEFLGTAYGQSIATDLLQFRENSIGAFKRSCSDFAILTGIQALRKTGLFVTKSASEITQLREIQQQLTCCLGWKPEIHYSHEEPFETEYEQGVLTEEGTLRLRSSRTDYARAEWVGEWIYRYSGREGRGEGVSQGTLIYHSGEDQAVLTISPSRVSSTGRMNFPTALSGEKRTVTVDGVTYNPQAALFAESFSLKGCRDKK